MAYIYKKPRQYKTQLNRVKRQDIYNTGLWKRLRLAKLRETPICEVCELEGKTRLAEHIHHLISFLEADNPIDRDRLAYDYNNLLSVCHDCHNEIHNGKLKGCRTLEQIRERIEMENRFQSLL